VLAHVRSLSWETVLHAAVKVVAEEEQASAPHFLGVRMPLLEEFVASVSQLVETATHTPDAGAGAEESSADDEESSAPRRQGRNLRRKSGSHLLGRSPAELMPSWNCKAAGLTLQDLLHWLITGMALSEPLSTPPAPRDVEQPVPHMPEVRLKSTVGLGLGGGQLLHSQQDYDRFDEVLSAVERATLTDGNFSLAAAALRACSGAATHGHARASEAWTRIEDTCPDAWASLARHASSSSSSSSSVSASVHDGLRDTMLAFIAAARDMKTLVFAEALEWNRHELLERRAWREQHLPRHL
jgi:hypothetical protein